MIDRFGDGLLTPTETSHYLQIPRSTLDTWLHGKAAGRPAGPPHRPHTARPALRPLRRGRRGLRPALSA